MLILDANTKAVQLITGAALSTDWTVSYADHTSSTFAGADSEGNVATATTTTIVAAPSASTQRQIKSVTIKNRDGSSPQTVTLVKDSGGTDYHLTPAVVLEAGESLIYLEEVGFTVYTAAGLVKGASGSADGLNRISAGTQIAGTLATVVFSSSHNVAFGMSNSSIVTASAPIKVSAGAASALLTALTIADSNGVSAGLNAGTLTLSHNGLTSQSNQALSAANGSFTFQTAQFSNAGGVTFSTSAGSAIVASVVPAGIYRNYEIHDGQMSAAQIGIGTVAIHPLNLPRIEHDRLGLHMVWTNNAASTGSATVSFWAGLYTRSSDSISLASSSSSALGVSFAGTASDLNGHRLFTIGWTNTIPPGDYYMGVMSSTATAGANGSASQMVYQQLNSQFSGILGGASGASVQMQLGMGHYSASTSELPAAIAFSEILGRSSAMHQPPAMQFLSVSA